MILFLHHRYRIPGGEERAVDDLAWLVRTHLDEDATTYERASASLTPAGAAAGLVGGGLHPDRVADAVRRTGARIVHAHNLQPTLGWRALAAARRAGARVVLHLHQYRLVCAIGVCFRDGAECTECHGRDTLPGVRHGCRGSRGEALAYAAGLALWQRRLVEQADVVAVPSRAALARLHELGAPVGAAHVVGGVVRGLAVAGEASSPPRDDHARRRARGRGRAGALVASRLAPEKGVDVAIAACAAAGVPLTVAGEGPERERLERLAATTTGAEVSFLGRVERERLAELRRSAAVGLVPSRSAESFGLAAAEAMAAGLPVAASRIGALAELVPGDWLAAPGDPVALAAALRRARADPRGPERALAAARAHASPDVVAGQLRAVYAAAVAAR